MWQFAALAIVAADPSSFTVVVATNHQTWLGPEDYPLRAVGMEKAGVTQADIFVDADGKPHNCVVTGTSGSEDLDVQSCAAAIRRGKFKPARDADGQAMSGIYRYRTRWVMPDRDTPNAPADVMLSVPELPDQKKFLFVALRYIVDETGQITGCGVEMSSGYPKVDVAACRAMPKRYRFAPARDNAGKAWRVVRTQMIGFEATAVAAR